MPERGPISLMAAPAMKLLTPSRKQIEAKDFLTCREARLLLDSCPSGDDNKESLTKIKVLLRNRETGQYYTGSNGWNGDSSVAHDFDTVESAIKFAKTERLAGLEVLVRDNFGHEMILPLRE